MDSDDQQSALSEHQHKRSKLDEDEDESADSVDFDSQSDSSEDNWTASNSTKVGNCDVILTEIFRSSSTADLLTFRSVNRKWKNLSTNTIRHRSDLQVYAAHFEYTTVTDIGVRSALLCHVKKFPSSLEDFEIKSTELQIENVQTFLNNHGEKCIKELFIEIMSDQRQELALCRKLIFLQAPNLKTLDMYCNILKSSNKEEEDVSLMEINVIHHLPSIKYLNCYVRTENDNFTGLMNDIVRAAVNLKEFNVHGSGWLKCIPTFIASEKTDTIKVINFQPSASNIGSYQLLVDMNLEGLEMKLEEIDGVSFKSLFDHPESYSKAATIFNRILNSCQESLQKIRNYEPVNLTLEGDTDHSNTTVQLPKLPNLHTLSFARVVEEWLEDQSDEENCQSNSNRPSYSMFPHGFKPAIQLPKVKNLTIFPFDFGWVRWDNFFPPPTSLMKWLNVKEKFVMASVTHLTIFCICGGEVMNTVVTKCGGYFPNVTSLHITDLELDQFADTLKAVWLTYPNIEKLIFHVHAPQSLLYGNSKVQRDLTVSIDSAITGLTKETCIELLRTKRKLKRRERERRRMKSLRTSPSIVDMKRLKIFYMHFLLTAKFSEDFGDYEDDEMPAKIFSRVSVNHGFKMNRRLNVKIYARKPCLTKSFRHVKSYLNDGTDEDSSASP